MTIAQSKITAQGRISAPAEIRKKLGLRPGSALEWDEKRGEVGVRSAGRYPSAQVHEASLGVSHTPKRNVDAKEGTGKHIHQRHARD